MSGWTIKHQDKIGLYEPCRCDTYHDVLLQIHFLPCFSLGLSKCGSYEMANVFAKVYAILFVFEIKFQACKSL
jgi:hypothetical protein